MEFLETTGTSGRRGAPTLPRRDEGESAPTDYRLPHLDGEIRLAHYSKVP